MDIDFCHQGYVSATAVVAAAASAGRRTGSCDIRGGPASRRRTERGQVLRLNK